MRGRLFSAMGAVFAMAAVMLGAFGAHGLKGALNEYAMSIFQTAVQYQMYHALGLLVLGMALLLNDSHAAERWLHRAGWFLLFGVCVFCGSLYALVASGIKWLGAITPVGGVAFIAGWLCITVGMLKFVRKGSSDSDINLS